MDNETVMKIFDVINTVITKTKEVMKDQKVTVNELVDMVKTVADEVVESAGVGEMVVYDGTEKTE